MKKIKVEKNQINKRSPPRRLDSTLHSSHDFHPPHPFPSLHFSQPLDHSTLPQSPFPILHHHTSDRKVYPPPNPPPSKKSKIRNPENPTTAKESRPLTTRILFCCLGELRKKPPFSFPPSWATHGGGGFAFTWGITTDWGRRGGGRGGGIWMFIDFFG